MSRDSASPKSNAFNTNLIWDHMRVFQHHFGGFTPQSISDTLLILTHTAQPRRMEGYFQELCFNKIIQLCENGLWQVVKRSPYAPPYTRLPIETLTAYQALWTAIRSLRDVAPKELMHIASTDKLIISPFMANRFCDHFYEAGYLKKDFGFYRLLLANNTGPRAPLICLKDGIIYDVNLMKAVVNLNQKSRRAA